MDQASIKEERESPEEGEPPRKRPSFEFRGFASAGSTPLVTPSKSTPVTMSGFAKAATGSGAFGSVWRPSPPPSRATSLAASKRFNYEDVTELGLKVTAVRVGTDASLVDFTVHESLLRRSEILRKLLDDSHNTAIRLPTFKASAFAIYVQWLYSRKLHTRISKTPTSTIAESSNRREWFKLVDCYVLGEYIGDFMFQDEVIDVALEWFRELDTSPHPKELDIATNDKLVLLDNVSDVYNNTKAGCPLRGLVSDIVAYHFEDRSIQELRRDSEKGRQFPYDFVLDVATKLSSRYNGLGMEKMSPVQAGLGNCQYHCHGDKGCYRLSKSH